MKNIKRRCNLMMDLSKCTSSKNILSKIETLSYNNFVAKLYLLFFFFFFKLARPSVGAFFLFFLQIFFFFCLRDFFLQLYALFYILFGCSVNRMNVPKILLWSLFVRLFTVLNYCRFGTRDVT